jgi:hypothetical protein
VSDNSTTMDATLASECRRAGVVFIRPERELDVAAHWDWAIRQAMLATTATHFTVHYDRKVTKPRQFCIVQKTAEQWPQSVITWSSDSVSRTPPPLRVWQPPWTGDVFAIRSERVLELVAQGRAGALNSNALPLLSNCIVPRSVLQAVIEEFGDLCVSTTPDSCFGFRFLSQRRDYLHLDRSLGVLHLDHYSAGAGYRSGVGGDYADFRRLQRPESWLDAAPIRGLALGMNMLYHEYELVRRATGERLHSIDRHAYLQDLARALPFVEEDDAREVALETLRMEGWDGPLGRLRFHAFLRHRVLGFVDRFLGIRLPGIQGRVVPDDDAGLRFALHHPRVRGSSAHHLALLAATRVGTT